MAKRNKRELSTEKEAKKIKGVKGVVEQVAEELSGLNPVGSLNTYALEEDLKCEIETRMRSYDEIMKHVTEHKKEADVQKSRVNKLYDITGRDIPSLVSNLDDLNKIVNAMATFLEEERKDTNGRMDRVDDRIFDILSRNKVAIGSLSVRVDNIDTHIATFFAAISKHNNKPWYKRIFSKIEIA